MERGEEHYQAQQPNHSNCIVYKNKIIRSPKLIAEAANKFYIDKIKLINKSMELETRDPIKLLSRLVPRREGNNFYLKEISLHEMYKLLRNMKGSNSVGYDSITTNVLKKLGSYIVPQLAHMINCIIKSACIPDGF